VFIILFVNIKRWGREDLPFYFKTMVLFPKYGLDIAHNWIVSLRVAVIKKVLLKEYPVNHYSCENSISEIKSHLKKDTPVWFPHLY